jgi:sugar lactone lactonase YvrE
MPRQLRLLAAAAIAAGFTAVLSAASPVFWTVSTQTDFLKGTVDGIAIDAEGRLRLGPLVDPLVDPKEPFIWSIAQIGSAWYAGTGNDGKVLKFDGASAPSIAFDAAELGVHAVLDDGRGGFYAATGPDGRVHHVDASGKASVFFDPEDRYIWSLARAADGTVYVGTGDRGVIYRVRPGQPGEPLYRTRTANVISLALDAQGRLYAGTSTPGRLFRIDQTGRAFVVIDSPHQEVRGLKLGADGAIYAAALTPAQGDDSSANDASPVPTVTAQVGGVTVGETGAGAPSPSADSKRTGRGAVYVVRNERADLVWETGSETPYDLLPSPDGRSLLVATGGNGRLYEIDLQTSPANAILLGRVDARQVTQAARSATGEIVLASSNPGRIFRLRAQRAGKGTFESDIRDAGSAARWGSIRWRSTGAGTLQIATRSGNTNRPDDTWSDWSAPYSAADGSPISSPSARYLQWRAVLSGTADASPQLTSVTVAYLPRNARPTVNSITVHPPGVVFQRPFSSNEAEIAGFEANGTTDDAPGQEASQPSVGRRMYRKGLQTFQWRADDPNDDRMTYTVSYRREGESAWRVLRSGLGDPIFVWDTTSVPDGRYVIRVTASDMSVNSPADGLEGARESDGFDVDNTAPVITLAAPAAQSPAVVRVTVRDTHSGVQRVEYAVGGDKWQVVYPADGLSDSREEVYEIKLPSAADRARLVIRATDVLQNVATAVGGQ